MEILPDVKLFRHFKQLVHVVMEIGDVVQTLLAVHIDDVGHGGLWLALAGRTAAHGSHGYLWRRLEDVGVRLGLGWRRQRGRLRNVILEKNVNMQIQGSMIMYAKYECYVINAWFVKVTIYDRQSNDFLNK